MLSLFGVLSGVTIYLILYLANEIFPRVFKEVNQIMRLIPLAKSNIILIIILPAIIEELFFRGVLQELLGIMGTNILFAFAHMGKEKELISYGVVTFLIGIVLSILYIKTADLLVPMLAHATINALTLRRLINERKNKKSRISS